MDLLNQIKQALDSKTDYNEKIDLLNEIKEHIHKSMWDIEPVDFVKFVPIEKVEANDYNPNSVATKEMKLLYNSIKEDWYTQPVVVIYDDERDKYVIIDWFHRHLVMKTYKDIKERSHWYLPVVILKSDIKQRMASTVRHNRARWSHSINWMSNIVFSMLEEWRDDVTICNKLWLEVDELVRLKHLTWFSKLFENTKYNKARHDRKQLLLKKQYHEQNKNNLSPN